MKKMVSVLVALCIATAIVMAFAGDIGVGTWITQNAAKRCVPGQAGYTVWFNITNYDVYNATGTNVSYYANITDDGVPVYSIYENRYLALGETHAWSVTACTIGNQTNHTITSTIRKLWPSDNNPYNDEAIFTRVIS